MDNLAFTAPFISGLVFTAMGFIMLRFPPKKINSLYGYRTQASKQTQAQWDFAQGYSSRQMIKLGVSLFFISFVAFFLPLSETISAIVALILLISMIAILMSRVEAAIKDRFDDKPDIRNT